MKKREKFAYILADANGHPYSTNGAVAARGFAYLGYTIQYFTKEALASLSVTPNDIVVAGVGTMHAVFDQMGVRPPSHATAPACLYPFLGRRCWRTTVGEIREQNQFPVFIKPYEDNKRFTGFVAKSMDEIEAIPMAIGEGPLPDDYPLMAHETVNFLSEWRTFVIRGHVVGTCLHQGDPLLFPNPEVIKQTIGAYTAPMAGYSADFGVTDTGRTLLVEINEGYSLGCGHLVANLYAELLKAHWEEIMERAV
jgi:ATP-grasp domain, R2K clade family 3